MKTPKLDRSVVVTLALAALVLLTALAARWTGSAQSSQTELLLQVSEIEHGAAIVAAESKSLQQNNQALMAIQQANDRNIAAWQLLMQGSVKRDLPSAEDLTGELPASVIERFDAFQAAVTELIQSRSLLDNLLQGRDALNQATTRLASQSEGLADGVEQQSSNLDHLRAAYRIRTTLIAHAQAVRQAYLEGTGAPALPWDNLRADLQSLSTDSHAPPSPTLRRTAANLLSQLEDHQTQLEGLEQHHVASQKLADMQLDLQKKTRQLQQQLEAVSAELYAYTPISLYVMLGLALGSLGMAGWLGYLIRHRMDKPVVIDTSSLAPASNGERTSPTFMSQLKTEKNLLMNDIKPIGEGILYIKADEHMESTGDLARCLNQSREALVRRIEQLKRQVLELQSTLAATPTHTATPTAAAESHPSADKAQLIDLTFKGHAELDGLQRHLRNQSALDKEECKQLLIRCLKTERVLDEIRVRLKKSEPPAQENTGQKTAIPGANPAIASELASALVTKLVEQLDELQTQPVKGKRARNVPL